MGSLREPPPKLILLGLLANLETLTEAPIPLGLALALQPGSMLYSLLLEYHL